MSPTEMFMNSFFHSFKKVCANSTKVISLIVWLNFISFQKAFTQLDIYKQKKKKKMGPWP